MLFYCQFLFNFTCLIFTQVLVGKYQLSEDKIKTLFKRRAKEKHSNRTKSRRYRGGTTDVKETTFNIVRIYFLSFYSRLNEM